MHHRAQVAPAHVDIDPAGQPSVFAAQHRRAFQPDMGHVLQQQLRALSVTKGSARRRSSESRISRG
jgi:hypothetical protein